MKYVLAIIMIIASVAQAEVETTIKVPLINPKGQFVSKTQHYAVFTSTNREAVCEDIGTKINNDLLWYASHPHDFADVGQAICYTGDAREAMNILLNLADCALSDQFTTNRYFVKNGAINIENTSNDDGTDVEWSNIKKCNN